MNLAVPPPNISEAESVVMDALWAHSPLAAEAVVAAVAQQRGWAAVTVKTLLNRLLKKGAVTVEQVGRRYLYSPAFARDAMVQQASLGLLERLFGGRVAPLVAHFGERGALTAEDLADIKALIAKLEAKA